MKKGKTSLDALKHLEDISSGVHKTMAPHAQNAIRRYPITFGLLMLLGGIALHDGLKGILRDFGLLSINPFYLLLVGVLLLSITGSLYKKLDN